MRRNFIHTHGQWSEKKYFILKRTDLGILDVIHETIAFFSNI